MTDTPGMAYNKNGYRDLAKKELGEALSSILPFNEANATINALK